MPKRKVILITDGDRIAKDALEEVARRVGGRCISLSAGNPSPLTGPQLVELIKQAAYDPVLVMFDDCGSPSVGLGEQALKYVANHPEIEVLGAVAVASNCYRSQGTPVQMALDCHGNVVSHGVDKFGQGKPEQPLRIFGDTVEVLNKIQVPMIVGIGDVGKMRKNDQIRLGAPVTTKAVQLILDQYERNAEKQRS